MSLLKPESDRHKGASLRVWTGRIVGLIGIGVAAGPSLRAQPALRASLAGALAAQARSRALEEGGYNLKSGAFRLLLRTSLGIEFDDNINYSTQNRLSDLIAVPHVGANVSWRVSAKNTLKVGLDLGYRLYISHPEYNRPDFGQAGSEVSFDLYAGDFVITPYDRFQYRYDIGLYGGAVGQANYGGLDNTLGVNALWDLNNVVVTFGYGWNFFLSDTEEFSYQDRNSHFVLTRVALLPMRPLIWGLEATAGVNEYVEPILNNSRQASFGAFMEWPLTKFVSLTARGGGVVFSFDQTGLAQSLGSVSDPYYELSLSHQINRYFRHSLSGGRSLSLGFYGDLQSQLQLQYQMSFSGIRNVPLSWGVSYSHREEPTIEFPLTWDQIEFHVGVGYRLARRLSAGLGYSYYVSQSQGTLSDYDRNTVRLSLTYQF